MWDFLVRIVCVRECVKTQDKVKSEKFSRVARKEAFLRSDACAQHMTRMRRVRTGW